MLHVPHVAVAEESAANRYLAFCVQQPAAKELLTLYKCQGVLLRLAEDLREALHCVARDRARFEVWREVHDLRESARAQRAQDRILADKTIPRIRQWLAQNHEPAGRPVLVPLVASLPRYHNSKKWTTRLLKKLQTSVAQQLLLSLVELLAFEHTDDPSPALRAEIRDKYAVAGAMDPADTHQLALVLQTLTDLVERRFQPTTWWAGFWDMISEQIGEAFTGRICQQKWLHTFHPDAVRRNGRFLSEADDEVIRRMRAEGASWPEIAAAVDADVLTLYKHYRKMLTLSRPTTWSTEELQLLESMVDKYQSDSHIWLKVSSYFPGKSASQCQQKYETLKRAHSKTGNWSIEEDLLIQAQVVLHGRGNWVRIQLPHRTDVQIRERYENLLAPEIEKQRAWTAEEDHQLFLAVMSQDRRRRNWSSISCQVNGGTRTDADCKKRWVKLYPAEDIAPSKPLRIAAVPQPEHENIVEYFQALPGLMQVPEDRKETARVRKEFRAQLAKPFKELRTATLEAAGSDDSIFRVRNYCVPMAYRPAALRLAVLETYIHLVTMKKHHSKRLAKAVAKGVIDVRCRTLGLPPEALELYPLTSVETGVLKRLVNADVPLTQLVVDETSVRARAPLAARQEAALAHPLATVEGIVLRELARSVDADADAELTQY